MNRVRLVCAVLLALPLIVFGGNHFVELFDIPEQGEGLGVQLLRDMRTGGLMTWVAASHVAVGVLLLLPSTRFLGALLQLPITLGILAFHMTMLPAGNGMALGLLVLNALVLTDGARWGALLRGAPKS